MSAANGQTTQSGGLAERDRAFLRDIEQTNWLNHYVVARALKRAGSERLEDDHEHTVAGSIVEWNNHDTNPSFFDREQIEVSTTLIAQVQAIATLRIFQERTAAMESLGALLAAMKRRAEDGVALRYVTHDPNHITQFYREVLSTRGTALWLRLGWPSPEMIRSLVEEGGQASSTKCTSG